MKRIVVTGIGLISPLGINTNISWKNIINNKSGIKNIKKFNSYNPPVTIAAQIQSEFFKKKFFYPKGWISIKEQKKLEPYIIYALSASIQAIKDSDLNSENYKNKNRIGVSIGSGVAGINRIYKNSIYLEKFGYKKIKPFFLTSSLINLASSIISIYLGLKGPNHTTATSCSASADAITNAYRIIYNNEADIMITGGTEAPISPIILSGFHALKALSTNNNPKTASKPWDKTRNGFILGEGAGILILEELKHAKKRKAKIYAEIIGHGNSGDAQYITKPSNKNGIVIAMKLALKNAKISPENIDYINAHGTSTLLGDITEILSIKKICKNYIHNISMSSTKSATGHLLGAAGSIEAILTILAIKNQITPPTLGIKITESECNGIDLIPNKSRKKSINIAVSNSLGFGGTNVSILFKKY